MRVLTKGIFHTPCLLQDALRHGEYSKNERVAGERTSRPSPLRGALLGGQPAVSLLSPPASFAARNLGAGLPSLPVNRCDLGQTRSFPQTPFAGSIPARAAKDKRVAGIGPA